MGVDRAVEGEDHFLSKCNACQKLRVKHNITGNYVDIIKNLDHRNLAHYLTKAFDLRRSTMGDNT